MAPAEIKTEPNPANTLPADSRLASSTGAVSWGAVFAGAVAAAAISLILIILGTGLGLASVSPWTNAGAGVAAMGISAILWMTFTQLAASGLGGYLAGRLRMKWVDVGSDEVYFRDTAHGLLAWAVASLATAILLTSVIGSIISGATTVAGGVAAAVAGSASAAGAKSGNGNEEPMAYLIDSLFRSSAGTSKPVAGPGTGPGTAPPPTAEVARIFANAADTGELSPEDARYIGQLVAQQTGLSQQEAEKRVTDIHARAQEKLRTAADEAKAAADEARKAASYSALWMFISLLAGAFIASWLATCGGRQRDA